MARLRRIQSAAHRHRIALIDDDPDLVASTRALLARDGHDVHVATSPEAGVELVRTRRPHLLLLDYLMPGATGADVVRAIREFDQTVQIVLLTGYAEEQPGRRLLRELDIQGYFDKADGPEQLMVQVDAALKHYRAMARLADQRRRLMHVVAAGPDVSRLQPAEDLFRAALDHLVGLVEAPGDGLVATSNNGLFVLEDARCGVSVRAATGKYEGGADLSDLPPGISSAVERALQLDVAAQVAEGVIAVPLVTRNGDRGCIVLEASSLPPDCSELCSIYARLVTQALENLVLYEQATRDALTRVWNRGFGTRRLEEVLKLANRSSESTAVILADIDHFKAVNDRWGHAAGDIALVAVAQRLQEACRGTDVVCRHGGEEFLVVLPSTDAPSAAFVAEKLRVVLEQLHIEFDGSVLPITASFGVAAVDATPWNPDLPGDLIRAADEALYRAKADGRNRVHVASAVDAAA